MKKVILLFLNAFMTTLAIAQQADFNLELLGQVFYPEGCNDIWGYVDTDGTEYAILGTRTATTVISLADPENPQQVFRIDGDPSTWRDIKVYKNRAYVTVDDGDDGLLILNLENLPNGVTGAYQNTQFELNGQMHALSRCHNIYIDTVIGHMYLSGCNSGDNGVLIWDLTEDLDNPKFLGAEERFYSHDNMARGDTLWTSDLTQGFAIWDVSDPTAPVELGRQLTTSEFAHNGWLSDDGKYFFTTDERGNANVDAYDVSDPSNIEFLDAYHPISTANRGVIPHNTHYFDGYLVTSWYTDGIKILDGSRPHNLIEVGSYDSWLGADGGFNGCWGAYPWLPSGLVLASDIQEGLLVLRPNYQRACWLEGNITNNLDFGPVSDATVTILGGVDNLELSDVNGDYATGQAEAGMYMVSYTHPDFQDTTLEVELQNGIVTIQDVELRAKPFYRVTVNVIDAETKNQIEGAQILLQNDFRMESAETDADGSIELVVFEDQSNVYTIYAGQWGYLHGVLENADLDAQTEFTLELNLGYQDDFHLEQGWKVSGNAARGQWVRDIPIGTSVNGEIANPVVDVDSDLGDYCFVTGNEEGNAGQADVDEGVTILTSPAMDLTAYKSPSILFKNWFFNGSRPDPNDSMRVILTNGIDEAIVFVDNTSSSVWSDTIEIQVEQFITLSDSMTIRFEVADDARFGHVVEGAIDEFYVTGRSTTSNPSTSIASPILYPSLTHGPVRISNIPDQSKDIKVIDYAGAVVMQKSIENQRELKLDLSTLKDGAYIIQIDQDNSLKAVLKK